MNQRQQIMRQVFLSLALVVATLWVYLPVRHYGFVNLDDDVFVTENPNLGSGVTWRSVHWAFTAGLTHKDPNTDYWRPVSLLSHAVDIELFGLHPAGHHLMNVGLHALAAVALFLVLQSMTNAPWRCAFVAALFALHPLRVESVAWVTERKDVLSGLFFILTIGAYTRYVRRPFSIRRYLAVFFAFALALMSKPMVVTLPCVLLLLDYWPLGRTKWAPSVVGSNQVPLPPDQLLKEKIPLFALSAASSIVSYLGQRMVGGSNFAQVPAGLRIANALLSYAAYIGKMFWPTGLAVWYPLHPGLPAAAVIASGLGLVGVTTIVIRGAPRRPWLFTGWFWYLGMLVPVIGLFQGNGQAMADRFTYLPMVGLFIMAGWSVPSLSTTQWNLKVITGFAAAAVLAACAVLSRVQLGYWKDSETLFRQALATTRDNWRAHNNLGDALMKSGRLPEAIDHLEQAIQINQYAPEAHNNLGNALTQSGRLPEAIAQYEQALRIDPWSAEAHNNLGNALTRSGRNAEAIAHLDQALQINPNYAAARNNLGNALTQSGRMPEAIEQYEQALRIKSWFAEARNNLGDALTRSGRMPEAIAQYEQALRINPWFAEAHNNLGNALTRSGRNPEAIEHLEQALRINPDFGDAHYNLGLALAQAGRNSEAIAHLEQALRINPNSAEMQCNLGVALAQAGRVPEAIEHFEQALRINPDFAEAHCDLGVALAQAGRIPEAITHLQQALRIKPDFTLAQNALARLQPGQ